MDTAKRQKIESALCTSVAYATKGFLVGFAVVFSLMFAVCLVQLFREPGLGLLGCFGFGGGAWILWEVQKMVQTR